MCHGMFGVAAGPKTKTVVVFCHKDYRRDACISKSAHPSICINVGRIENGWRLLACAPLSSRESVHAEMYETKHLALLVIELPIRWSDLDGSFSNLLQSGIGLQGDRHTFGIQSLRT